MDTEIEKHYQMQAKDLVDNIFDAKLFNEKLSRDDINAVEDTFAYILQSNVKSAMKMFQLLDRIEKTNAKME
ncbi:MAG: hypothetical protein KAU50_11475 [Candidatus Marinimicrobia bacterium]|nr:hypothetical protein [Candidatus Neomarinimicrobiota bacterium]